MMLMSIEKLRPYLSNQWVPTLEDIYELQGLRLELAEKIKKAHEELLLKRRQVLYPKDKDLTELDRKVRMEGDIAKYEADYLFLLKVYEIVKDKILIATQLGIARAE